MVLAVVLAVRMPSILLGAALVPMAYAYVLALIAWLGYAALGGGAASGESFLQTFVIDDVHAPADVLDIIQELVQRLIEKKRAVP